MRGRSVVAAVTLAATLGLAGCHQGGEAQSAHNHAAVLGGYGSQHAPAAPLLDARGQAIPQPAVPANTPAQTLRSGDESAVSVWVQEGHVMASSWTPGTGWTKPQPLEQIYGQASDPQLASNGAGAALTVWRHTVGTIQSLRFSRFDAAGGWSAPDVVPGALPRPAVTGVANADAPRLQMDAQGNVLAEWPSGFGPGETQEGRFVAGQGWTVSERLASAPSALPGSPAPSSAR